jgi:tetratricopeptide (TPR) repeat protein
MVQFLIGREYFFLVEREAVLDFDVDGFLMQAEQSFIESTEIDPDYARAYIGLGSVHFKRALRLMLDDQLESSAEVVESPDFAISMEYIDQAIAVYNQALDLGSGSQDHGIPIVSVAHLGLGNSYRLKGVIFQRQGESAPAMELFDRSIETLLRTIQPFEQASQARFLTQTYEYLGLAYESKAHTHNVNQDYDRGLEAYNRSLEYYDKCISQGTATQDLIIKHDIVEGICTPNRENVKQLLDELGGAQG